jgi:hypothetical protein
VFQGCSIEENQRLLVQVVWSNRKIQPDIPDDTREIGVRVLYTCLEEEESINHLINYWNKNSTISE